MRKFFVLSAGIVFLYFVSSTISPVAQSQPTSTPVPQKGKIAFAWNQNGGEKDYEIYTVDLDGSNLQRLTHNADYEGYPDWSQDGKKLLFISAREFGQVELIVLNADGSNPESLTSEFAYAIDGRWSPDGNKIVFSAEPPDDVDWQDIYVMNADGSDKTNLTSGFALFNTLPFWSPNGMEIYFLSDKNIGAIPASDPRNLDVYRMKSDGSHLTQLFSASSIVSAMSLSPDGTHILTNRNTLTSTIATINPDGSDEILLTEDSTEDTIATYPAWSPDGEKIVYVQNGNSLVIINTDGTDFHIILSFAEDSSIRDPDWQPVIAPANNPPN